MNSLLMSEEMPGRSLVDSEEICIFVKLTCYL